jgi:CRP-like cAMP-binding protein
MRRIVQYPKDHVIIQAGDESRDAYIIRKGFVEVYKTSPQYGDQILARLGTGDLFGEMALITGRPRMANVRALEDVSLAVITPAEFEDELHEDPTTARNFLNILAERLRQMNNLATDLTHRVFGEVPFHIY